MENDYGLPNFIYKTLVKIRRYDYIVNIVFASLIIFFDFLANLAMWCSGAFSGSGFVELIIYILLATSLIYGTITKKSVFINIFYYIFLVLMTYSFISSGIGGLLDIGNYINSGIQVAYVVFYFFSGVVTIGCAVIFLYQFIKRNYKFTNILFGLFAALVFLIFLTLIFSIIINSSTAWYVTFSNITTLIILLILIYLYTVKTIKPPRSKN